VLEHGFRIRVVVTDHDSPEIDCPEDLERLQRHRLKES
jgi:CMP-2-keto-3-deoxyoctulosonic acid synthetase